nr:uncharacterized protein LOC100214616 isoform X2 [Hydra vulgaris]
MAFNESLSIWSNNKEEENNFLNNLQTQNKNHARRIQDLRGLFDDARIRIDRLLSTQSTKRFKDDNEPISFSRRPDQPLPGSGSRSLKKTYSDDTKSVKSDHLINMSPRKTSHTSAVVLNQVKSPPGGFTFDVVSLTVKLDEE